jgi:hypothetical protein
MRNKDGWGLHKAILGAGPPIKRGESMVMFMMEVLGGVWKGVGNALHDRLG